MRNKIAIFIGLLLVIISTGSICSAGNLPARTSQSERFFFYSEKFSERFNVTQANRIKHWRGTVAVSIDKDKNAPSPACKVTLYLGNDVSFKYPQRGNYMNMAGQNIKNIFFFSKKLGNADKRYITKNTLKGSNKVLLKSYNRSGDVIGLTGLTIRSVHRNIVDGINVIETLPIFCDIFSYTTRKVKLIFLDSRITGGITRTHTLTEYELPALKIRP